MAIDSPNTMNEEQFEMILLMDCDFMDLRGHAPRNVFHRMTQQNLGLSESGLTAEDLKEILENLKADGLDVIGWCFDDIHTELAVPEMFRSLFEDIEELAIDYKGDIPEKRPLMSYEVTEAGGKAKVYLLTGRNIIFRISLNARRNSIDVYYEDLLELYTGPRMFREFVFEYPGYIH